MEHPEQDKKAGDEIDPKTTPEPTENAGDGTTNAAKLAWEKKREAKKKSFLESYGNTKSMVMSCRAADVGRTTIWAWRKDDQKFNSDVEEIEIESCEVLEMSAYTRALQGSDLLTIFLLKALNPEKYRDLVKHEVDHRFIVDVSSQVIAIIKKLVPNTCPSCKTHLGLTNKIAAELQTLSQKMSPK